MYKVTYTDANWPAGKIGIWWTDRVQLEWFLLKQRMGMHPSMCILDIEIR